MNEITARKKIKKHLAERGDEPVILSERMVRRWWGILNVAVFDGVLKKPTKVQLIYASKFFGWIIAQKNQRVRLSMSPRYTTRRLFLSVLVHEMVHAWDHHHGDIYMRHGSAFMAWANKIKRRTTLILEKRYANT